MRVPTRGVTLLELMFVGAFFLVVLTVLTLCLRQTLASQRQIDHASEAMVRLELSRLKLSGLLRRSFLDQTMELNSPASSLNLRLFQPGTNGPALDSLGEPLPGESGTLLLDPTGNLVLQGLSNPQLVSTLGQGSSFSVTRLSESRFRFRLEAQDAKLAAREMVFEAGF